MITPLVRIALSWSAGIILAAMIWPVTGLRPSWWVIAVLGFGAVSVGILASERAVRRTGWLQLRLPCVLLACALLGAARHTISLPLSAAFGLPVDAGHVRVRGSVAREPDRRDTRTDYVLRVDSVEMAEEGGFRAAHGKVLLQAARWPALSYGDRLEVSALLETPPTLEGFDYRAYLARRGIRAIARRPRIERMSGGGSPVRHGLLALKGSARKALRGSLPEPEASLAVGILLGDARGIPAQLDADFRTTNTSHVIAISGSNIALLIVLLSATAGRIVGRRAAVPIVIVTVTAYSALVGADAAVVRAAFMGSIVVFGDLAGRPAHAATSLAAAAVGMSLWNPGVLWDLGFQLSFAATIGLLTIGPVLRDMTNAGLVRGLSAEHLQSVSAFLEEAVLLTVAAQLTTWPIIAMQTGEVSLVALLANALIVPVQPAVMALGGLTAAIGAIVPAAGGMVGLSAWPPLAWTIRVVEACAQLPYASVTWLMPPSLVLAYFCLLPAAIHPRRSIAVMVSTVDRVRRLAARALRFSAEQRPRRHGSGRRHHFSTPTLNTVVHAWIRIPTFFSSTMGLITISGLCAITWANALHQPDGLLHLYALDVGQGDALLVVTPNGRRMLVDGGPSPSAVLSGLGRRFPPWDRRLDVVVLTHPDADHVAGLPSVLDRYAVDFVLAPSVEHDTPDARAWRAASSQEAVDGARIIVAARGTGIILDKEAGVRADVLWPPGAGGSPPPPDAVNDHSVVLRLTHGHTTFLLTGDIETNVEARLVQEGTPLKADVLKLAHHGSDTSTTLKFLAAVGPSLAIVSVGAENRFGHPTEAVLARLAAIPLRRTDVEGMIEVIGDGHSIWLP